MDDLLEQGRFHQNTFRLYTKEFFVRFLPELLSHLRFDAAKPTTNGLEIDFRDKKDRPDSEILYLVERKLNKIWKEMLIYWTQWSSQPSQLTKQMFQYFCRLSLHYDMFILPIALYTGPAEADSAQWEDYGEPLGDCEIMPFRFPMIKLKSYSADKFVQMQPENPLSWAYLPFTSYGQEYRASIMARALQGIAICVDIKDQEKLYTLASLVVLAMKLNAREEMYFNRILQEPKFKEASMLYLLRNDWIRDGKIGGRAEGRAEGIQDAAVLYAKRMFDNDIDWRVITEVTGITPEKLAAAETSDALP